RQSSECVSSSTSSQRELFDATGAVGERIERYADFVEQGEVKIGQRHRLVVLDVLAALKASTRAAGDNDGQIDVIVHVGVAHTAAAKQSRVVEQSAFALGSGA